MLWTNCALKRLLRQYFQLKRVEAWTFICRPWFGKNYLIKQTLKHTFKSALMCRLGHVIKLSVFYYIRLSCANRHAAASCNRWKPLNEDWQQQKQEHRNGQMNQIRRHRSWRMSQWRPQQMTAAKRNYLAISTGFWLWATVWERR